MRLPNASARVDAALDEAREWPECTFGCCDLVGHIALAVSGEDKRELFPAYASQEEADALLAEYGGLAGILTHAFGDPIPVRKALKGDAVLVEIDGQTICGVVLGVNVAIRRVGGGITFCHIRHATAAWSVS
jgi:hypothetical protein